MAWYADLEACSCFGERIAPILRAVGWLERGQWFPTGGIDAQVFARPVEMRKDQWQPIVAAGFHECDLCQYESEASGTRNLFIPRAGSLYVCPELIVHYINAHSYVPPTEFCEALLVRGGRSLVGHA